MMSASLGLVTIPVPFPDLFEKGDKTGIIGVIRT